MTAPEIRDELSDLRRENARLYSHHSECKVEHGGLVELAQRWRIRAFMAEQFLRYLNKLNPFWTEDDLTKELELQTKARFEEWQRKERWWEDAR